MSGPYVEPGPGAPESEATATARRVINAAVIRDLERAGWERARRECAEELRAAVDKRPPPWGRELIEFSVLADRWSEETA